jgi:hypothetical protein
MFANSIPGKEMSLLSTPLIVLLIQRYADFAEEALTTMFTTITNTFFQNLDDSAKALIPTLVETQKQVFNEALLELLPTPARAHYLFNLRDTWKVFLGICSLTGKKVRSKIFSIYVSEKDTNYFYQVEHMLLIRFPLSDSLLSVESTICTNIGGLSQFHTSLSS